MPAGAFGHPALHCPTVRGSKNSATDRGSKLIWLAAIAVGLVPAARALADKGATVTIYQQSQNPSYTTSYGAYGGYNYGGYSGVSTAGSFAVVVERRNLTLKKGTNDVSFDGVASQIDPATVQFKSKTDPKTSVVEQKFVYDLASPDALLAKYVDKEITVVTDNGEITGRLLSFDSRQLVVKTADRKHPVRIVARGEHVRDIRFGALDEALVTKPTLNWKIKTAKAGAHTAEVTYRTAGLAWRADYTAIYDAKNGKVDLSGWVSLTNRAGTTFDNAEVVLVTGHLNKTTTTPNYAYGQQQAQADIEEMQVFALETPTTLEDRATVQLELFNPVSGTAAKDVLVYEALANTFYNSGYPNLDCYSYQYQAAKSHSDKYIELSALESKKGLTFPEGRARVFKKGKKGALELIGEDLLKPGSTGGRIRLRVGHSDMIKGERRQLDCRPDDRAKQMREKIELKLTNTSSRPAQVVIREYMQRWSNWSIESESEKGERAGQLAQEWRVKIPKKGSKTISYTVLYTW